MTEITDIQITAHQGLDNVHIIGKKGKWEVATLKNDQQILQILGWSFPSEYVKQDPSINIPQKAIDPNQACIGLIHGDLHDPESPYAPIDENNLKSSPVNAWIIGHIHKPEEVNSSEPNIHYPGSPQALSPKETGEHGVLMMEMSEDKSIQTERIPLSPVRYGPISVYLSQTYDEENVRQKLIQELENDVSKKSQTKNPPEHLIYDMILEGEHPQPEKAKEWAEGILEWDDHEIQAGISTKVRKVRSELMPSIENMEEWAKERSPAGKLAETILKLERGEDSPFIEEVINKWQEQQIKALKSETYRPLYNTSRVSEASKQEAIKIILKESKKLLRKFQIQQTQNDSTA
ncbi:MAG: exonuclease SbcCD subunit D [Flavobacteriales bacterium]